MALPTGMSGEFVVSIQFGGASRCVGDPTQVVVPAAFPSRPHGDVPAEIGKLHVSFAASRVYQVHDQPHLPETGEASSYRACDYIAPRQTFVVHGDPGSCSSASHGAWDGIISSLEKLGEACSSLAASARREWLARRDASHPQFQRNGCRAAACSGTFSEQKASSSSPICVSSWDRRLELLGSSRKAYARKLCTALSRHCRWRASVRPTCAECTRQCDCNFYDILSPSAAFSLVLHSEAFGLLAFCRDKLGLASLLAVGLPGQRDQRPCLALAASAGSMRMEWSSNSDKKNAWGQMTEVPVDGIWLVDLWELAESPQFHLPANATNAEDPTAVGSPLGMNNAFCIPWEYPSVIRGNHIWCNCEICVEARTQFWQHRAFSASSDHHDLPGSVAVTSLVAESLFSNSSLLVETPAWSSALNVARKTIPEDAMSLTSAHVLTRLYEQIFAAVGRAIPEALRRIADSAVPQAGCETVDPVFVGILFSGGLDSTLLAGVVLRCLAAAMLKVQRMHTAGCPNAKRHVDCSRLSGEGLDCECYFGTTAAADIRRSCGGSNGTDMPTLRGTVVVELVSVCFSEEAPDRLTALRSYEDLLRLLQSLGKSYHAERCMTDAGEVSDRCSFVVVGDWGLELRLVAVDASTADSADCRNQLLEAIRPKKSHMDFNIAAPLFFAARGVGYLVSPSFIQSQEWKQLCQDATVWSELVIRPPCRPRVSHFQPPISTEHSAGPESSRNQEDQTATFTRNMTEAMGSRCRVCRWKAKPGCVHCTCKLCCEKLKAVATQVGADPLSSCSGDIYVGGQGWVSTSTLGIVAYKTCPVHRGRNLQCVETQGYQAAHKGNSICPMDDLPKVSRRALSRATRPAPFESLNSLPCGISLATSQGKRPFMAMRQAELSWWCSEYKRREACVDEESGTYTLQSAVLLMGSGADELFGGYGRHRTANVTRGFEALRREQILDLERLWLRNMGRDARTLGVFKRLARFPFLDEYLLYFVCGAVPFEQIVQPGSDLREEAEAIMTHLQRAAACQTQANTETAALENPNEHSRHSECEHRRGIKGKQTIATASGEPKSQCIGGKEAGSLCCGNKWLLRACAVCCGLPFSAAAKKRAMQFGSRSAKVSNSECFASNRKSRGDATIDDSDGDTL